MIPPLIPIFDDIRDPLDTLIGWESLSATQLRAELEASLSNTAAFVDTGVAETLEPLVADLAALNTSIPADDLARIAERLTVRLGELRAAVEAAELSGTGAAVTEINDLLDEYDALRPGLEPTLAEVPSLALRLRDAAGDLDLSMARMISVLRPGGAVLSRVPNPAADSLAAFETWLKDLTDWLQEVVDALDLSALQEPIADIANATQDAADGLQQAIIGVTVNVQAIFTQIEELLNAVDPAAIQADVQAAIQQFRDQILGQINSRVEPARTAVLAAVGQIDSAVTAFDPQEIIDALTEAVDAIAAVLGEGDVAAAIGQVRTALEQAADQLESLEFTPVTDGVVSTIDGITSALSAIDSALLPAPAAEALQSAASVLPPDLEPVTTPILDEFGELVDSGPVPVLEMVRDQPAQLLEAVRSFDPASLIGDELSEPFNEIVRELERFRPSQLFEPVATELAALKERLRNSANPGQLAAPLQQPFDQLKQAFDSFDPDALIAPIDEALSATMERLLDILPVDETFGVIDEALGAVQRVVDSAHDVVSLMRRVRTMMDGLLDVRTQLEAWVDEVLDKVDALGDTSALQSAFNALSSALDETQAAAVGTRFASGTVSVRASLQTVGGTPRLAALIQAHNAVPRAALLVLPASAQKTVVLNAIDRFDPMLPAFGAPWQVLGSLQTALTEADSELQTLLAVWDDRFHATGGSLAALRETAATPAQLRAWANETLQEQLVDPIATAFGVLDPARAVLDGFLQEVEELVDALIDKLAALLLGPDSLGGIRTALGQIVAQLLDVDLEFLRTSLQQLFANVRQKLDNVSPARIGEVLDESFGQILDTITIDIILPPADVQLIDDTYENIIEKLRALDPKNIVTNVVQPMFDEKVIPLLEMFDLSPVLDKIIDKLSNMDDELKDELGRVNTSYKAMLAAVPAGGTQSASVSVSVG
jgi:hypothetical protein